MVIVHPHPNPVRNKDTMRTSISNGANPLPSRERGLLGHFYVYFSVYRQIFTDLPVPWQTGRIDEGFESVPALLDYGFCVSYFVVL
jgi:hypothetical protein